MASARSWAKQVIAASRERFWSTTTSCRSHAEGRHLSPIFVYDAELTMRTKPSDYLVKSSFARSEPRRTNQASIGPSCKADARTPKERVG